jgi:isopenicillin-N N-acyltransferase-like protein
VAHFPFPVISVKGSPFECGRQYGAQARAQISRNVALYFDLWRNLWGAERDEILKKCAQLVPVIGNYDGAILEELEGIACGAEMSLDEIVALNARYELVFALNAPSPRGNGGCTSAAALPSVTRNGKTILGQNWDWMPRFKGLNVILEVAENGKPALVTHTEAGAIAHKGMNAAGVAVCLNALGTNRDRFGLTIPFLVVARAILHADSLSRALKAVFEARVTVSFNFLIAHRDGEAIDLEVNPEAVGVVAASGGILTHSNNFLALTGPADLKDTFQTILPDTLFRHQRARRLIARDEGHIDIGSFQRAFRDHFSHPNSICRHPDPRDEEPRQLVTTCSVIMDLARREFYLTDGPPCSAEYFKLTPKSLR